MLWVVVVVGLIQLVAACGCYALARYRGPLGFALAAVPALLAFYVILMGFLGPALFFQFILLALIGFACLAGRRPSVRRFGLLGAVASAMLIGALGIYGQRQWAALADRFPVESLAERLAYETRRPPAASPGQEPDAAHDRSEHAAVLPTADALRDLDELYAGEGFHGRFRAGSLRIVHASQVDQFVNSDGFGIGRMSVPSTWYAELRAKRPLVPLGTLKSKCSPVENVGSQPLASSAMPAEPPSLDWVEPFHNEALVDFVNMLGFGYVQDRRHVVGFESHGFSQLPWQQRQQWQTIRVELVSLLKHDQPGVYVSEYLPAMDQLRNAPVRPLDAFEERSLALLAQGGDVEAEAAGQQVRMLGAIRAAKKCLDCHAVEHGALLGAFSYVLLPANVAPANPARSPAPEDSAQK
jgi:hypothetical protein